MRLGALIFDFDGVIADSELLANTVLADAVSALGRPMTADDAIRRYMGKRWPEVTAAVAADIERPLPVGFAAFLQQATFARFRVELVEVTGATAFIRRFAHLPQCIASSSSLERLHVCLEVLGLSTAFGSRVFSADMVAQGKPHPDLFLFAAERLGVAPDECIVVEDSVGGVHAARAAGMIAIGLSAAAHIRDGHAAALTAAGAHHVAATWAEVDALLAGCGGYGPKLDRH